MVKVYFFFTALVLVLGCGGDNGKKNNPVADIIPPPQPQNLQVDRIGDGEIWVSWTRVDEEDVAYLVLRSTGAGLPVQVARTFDTSYRDDGLDYDQEYSYWIAAVDPVGNQSERSRPVGGQPFNTLAPLAPTGVRAIAHNIFILNQLELSLDWDLNSETDLDHYRVYRAQASGPLPEEGFLLVQVGEARHLDLDVEVGIVYHYIITAVDKGGKESLPSEVVSDVPLAVPELEAPIEGVLSSSTPVFRWKAVPEALNYRVVVTSSPVSGEISDMPLTNQTSANFVGRTTPSGEVMILESGQIYYWKVIVSTKADGLENSVSRLESFKIR